jgi:hypothetical protein
LFLFLDVIFCYISVIIGIIIDLFHYRRGTAEKLRDQVKEAFSLPDAPQVLGPTLDYVGGSTFDTPDDSFISVSLLVILIPLILTPLSLSLLSL